MPPFPEDEYQARLRRVRTAMEQADLDLLLVVEPANIAYLSGYDGWSFYVPQMLVVPLEGQNVWVGRGMDVPGARATTYLPPDCVVGYEDHLVDNRDRHPFERFAQVIRERRWDGLSIGLEDDGYYVTPRLRRGLESQLPRASVLDATGLVNRVRLVKSNREIAVMREAARIAEEAMRVAVRVSVAGVRQSDAVAQIVESQIKGVGGVSGDYPAAWPHYLAGANAGIPHAPWSGTRLRLDEPVAVELAGCRHRYHAALARTIIAGKPEARLTALADVVATGMEATLSAMAPGVMAQDVEAAWRKAISITGHVKESRIGYSIGIGYPPVWGERSASLRPGDRTPLEADMTFHVILGMWKGDWGYELSETVRISPDGSEAMTRFPRVLLTGGELVE